MPQQPSFIQAGGHTLEYILTPALQPGRPTLVFLHEGLGCISLWRDFPQRVAQASGCRALVYSRYGYGQSDVLTGPRQPDYLHVEALEVLPELLAKLEIENPLLIGHSDGGSIALIHAGSQRWPVCGIVVMAPHCFVEDVVVQGLERIRRVSASTGLLKKLGRHHRDAAATFHGWNDIWLHPDFRSWNIESFLPGITCPVLAIQGEQDEYATMAQIDVIAAQASQAQSVELLKLAACGHSPHLDQPEQAIEAVVAFIARANRV